MAASEPRKPIKRRNKQATEAQILLALSTSLAQRGMHKTGINRVAELSGYNKLLIYRYFGGWNGLLLALHRQFWGLVLNRMTQQPFTHSTASLLMAFYEQLMETKGMQELYQWQLLNPSFAVVQQLHQQQKQLIQTQLPTDGLSQLRLTWLLAGLTQMVIDPNQPLDRESLGLLLASSMTPVQ